MILRYIIPVMTAIGVQSGDPSDGVQIRVDGARTCQEIEGFGATTLSLVYEGKLGDTLGPELRPKVLDALYNRVKLTMGNIAVGLVEGPVGTDLRQNDNDDPQSIDWNGFRTFHANAQWERVVKPAAPMGFDNYSLEGKINWRWSSPWLLTLYKHDRERCLDECAEQIEACVTYWKKIAGTAPRHIHLFNEPTSGNRETHEADAEMIRDLVKRVGRRLEASAFKGVKLVVPNEETVVRSTAVARVILADPEARRHVAAVGYHVYPYGSPYASVPRILKASGAGKPDEASIRQRQELRDLCGQHGIPLWMTEVSHGEVDPRSLDHLRGRAIHIHDEMVYAGASAFYGMNAMWDRKSHADHFAGRGGEGETAYLSEQDTIVLADNNNGQVLITGMGYAIGHYARWLRRGAVRIEASSDDPLLLVTAFRSGADRRLVLVLINNAARERTLNIRLSGFGVEGDVTGEQSSGHARWDKVKSFATTAADTIKVAVQALSVTTLGAGLTR